MIISRTPFRVSFVGGGTELKANGVQCGMSRKGDYWDNAVAKSFSQALKVELIHKENIITDRRRRQLF